MTAQLTATDLEVTYSGLTAANNTSGISIRGADGTFYMRQVSADVFTASRTLQWNLGNTARTLTLSGSPTLADWFDQNVKTTGTPTFAQLTCPVMNGNITNSTFAAFVVTNNAVQTFTKGSPVKLTLNTAIKNQGSYFNTSTSTFTAPVTGTYHFDVNFGINSAINSMSDTYVMLVTTAASVLLTEHNPGFTVAGTDTWSHSATVPMTAGDTAIINILGAGGTSTFASWNSDGLPRFSGFLVC